MDLPGATIAFLAAAPGWLAFYLAWRRARPEREKLDVDAEVSAAAALREARRDAHDLEAHVDTLRREREEIGERCRRCEGEVEKLRRLLQAAMVGAKLDTPNPDILAIFDEASDLWALTAPTDRGTFIWVSRGWTEQLGIEPRSMLGEAWRNLVTADTRKKTAEAEAAALSGSIMRFGNSFRCPDGRVARLLWWSTSYDGGSALCFARVVSVE